MAADPERPRERIGCLSNLAVKAKILKNPSLPSSIRTGASEEQLSALQRFKGRHFRYTGEIQTWE